MRNLNIWMNGVLVGTWSYRGRMDQSFRYASSWLSVDESRPISLSLPLTSTDTAIIGPEVEFFFDNLLPDNADIRRRIQRRFNCISDSPFDLLSEIGRDCVGAIQILPEGNERPDVKHIQAEPLNDASIASHLNSVTMDGIPGILSDDFFRISIAGAQEKAAFLFHEGAWCRPLGTTPTTHIFKLPLGRIGAMQIDMGHSIENEWLCLQLLAAFGMDVATTKLARFEDKRVLIVERFDRRLSPNGKWWLRIPQEDLCQATGTSPGKKYESEGGPGISTLMRLLAASQDSMHDRKSFLKAHILFALLAAPDGHAKNFSIFIERQGRFSLTPLYDVMSVYPIMGHGKDNLPGEKLRMAMSVTGKNRHYEWMKIQKRHWLSTADSCGALSMVSEIIDEILERLPSAISQVASNLPPNFPDSVASPIFDGIRVAAERLA